jgi:transposase
MIKAHKIRLHPTPEQATYFAKATGTARYTFNWAVAEWKRQVDAGEKPSALSLRTQFHALRREQLPWTYNVTKCAIEGAFMDVAAAFKNFFEGRKAGRRTGFPQFKSKKRSRQSFYLANDKFTVGDHWIQVPKLAESIWPSRCASLARSSALGSPSRRRGGSCRSRWSLSCGVYPCSVTKRRQAYEEEAGTSSHASGSSR